MNPVLSNPWEIYDFPEIILNKKMISDKYKFYDESGILQKSSNLKIQKTEDLKDSIEKSEIRTEIGIFNAKINNLLIMILITDKDIFIIKEENIPKFATYFKEHFKSLIYLTEGSKNYIENIISENLPNSEQIDHFFDEQPNINTKLEDEIIRFIIKKSQYRTLKIRHDHLKIGKETSNNYNQNDFIQIQTIRIYYNCKDQILNFLKFFDFMKNKEYNYEIKFYQQIENSFPFICKMFGKIQIDVYDVIILEYIEGETLNNFIKKHKEIDFSMKIKIIIEILFSVYYSHSNGFYLRDLKPDNIMIDSKNDAILIDFDSSKEMYSSNEEVKNTGNIGNPIYVAPELYRSTEYSYKVDSYSIGMIIHFIITGEEYQFDYEELNKIYENNENISSNKKFPKCPKTHEFILNIYKKCFEITPETRPSIPNLIANVLFDFDNIQLKNSNEKTIPNIIYEIEKYEPQFKISNKYEYEESFEQSYLEYFLGYVYYYGKYVKLDINKSIKYLEKSSNQNNSDAQCYLGEIYYKGKYISRDINKSIHYLTLSSNQNNSHAQYSLGGIYYEGKYISRDINKSIHYLTLSSNQNDSDAQSLLGLLYYNGQYISRDINKSIHYLTLSSNQNDSDAQSLLGLLYYKGQYISRDINKSIHYLTLSSNHNNSFSQFLLGFIYYEGKYITLDINKSIHYLTLSSKQNFSFAQCLLGYIYYEEKDISRDINKSIHYLTLSSNQNHSYAQSLLGLLYYNGQYISRDINKSIHYLTLSSNQNNSHAQFLLGGIYYEGKYISRDINKSIHYLILSSNQNNSYAQYLLGEIYYIGKYISRDINKSIHYLTLAAKQNHSDAQCFLGIIYYDRKFIEKNIKKSIHYFKEASSFNHKIAKNHLGVIYKNGDGVEKNVYHAITYFDEAIKQKDSSYSMYNLSRIYYFGIDIERDIPKSIELLKNASKKQFPLADLFLFYIFTYCDDSKFLNQKDSLHYKNKSQILLPFHNFFFNINDNPIIPRLKNFFKNYDLIESYKYSYDLYYYLEHGTFYDWGNLNDKSKTNDKSLRKNIDNDFYEGFYN